MAGYVSLVVGLLLMSGLGFFMDRAIRSGSLERNTAIGIRTRATLSSDEAWEAGHREARPYLQATALVGIVGVVVSVAALPFVQSGGRYVVPVAAFVVQIAVLAWGAARANSAAKAR